MQKPITIARREFVEAMSKLISESELPTSMVIDILKDAVGQLYKIETEQYERDKKQYEEAMREEEKGDGPDMSIAELETSPEQSL